MSNEKLLPGLTFASTHDLTKREIEALCPFLKKPYTTPDLAEELKVNPTTLHHLISRLKLKGLLTLKDKDKDGRILYEFNATALE